MRHIGWNSLPFEAVVEAHGSGSAGLPQKEWTAVGKFPVIGQGAEDVEGWTNREDLLLTPSPAVVLYGGHTRRVKHVSHPFVPGPNVKILKPIAGLDSKFLYYFLRHLPIESKGYADHFPLVRKFEVPVPPLTEQQRLVRLLDEAFGEITIATANTKKSLQNTQTLFESHLQAAFTKNVDEWNSNPLGELTDPNTPITYGVVKPGDEGEITFIRGGDLVGGKVRLDQLRTISRVVSNQYRRTVLSGGELLICLVGQPGQVAVAPKELAGANIARQVGLIRLKESIEADFAKYYLQSRAGIQALGARESGSVQQVINLSELKMVSLVYPELAQQRKIVAGLALMESEVNSLTDLYAQKRLQLEKLKQSLLHQVFSGRLMAA